jgi:hypothetical protein
MVCNAISGYTVYFADLATHKVLTDQSRCRYAPAKYFATRGALLQWRGAAALSQVTDAPNSTRGRQLTVDTPHGERHNSLSGAVPSPRGRVRALIERCEAIPPRRFLLVSLGVFVLGSLAVYWPQLPMSTHTIVGCPCGDSMQEVWFLKWTPWAILHGMNPLYTNFMDYPSGANLATNTVMPALAILVAPITWLWGAVASYNVLMWAAFPVSALACTYVVRRLTNSNLAALLAGALYGFSPYMAGQGQAHVFLIFVPLPPLIFYALYRIFIVQEGSPRRWGLVLAGLVIGQFFISQEVAADTLIVSFFAVAILVVVGRGHIDRSRVDYVLTAALYGGLTTLVVLAYPVYYQLWGPQAIHGSTHGTTHSPLKLDVLGTIVPNSLQAIHPGFLTSVGDKFMGGDLGEDGSYLGVPLMVALALILWKLRTNRWVLYVGSVLIATEVLSMGRWLMVANHTIHVPLPWTALAKLPQLQSDLPNRFALFASFFAAVLVAMGVAEWIRWAARPPRPRRRDRRLTVNVALGLLALCAVVVYAPQLPIDTNALPDVPSFFTSPEDLQIPAGSVVLAFPLSASPNAKSMYWQIESDFRWRMIAGEAIIPGHFNTVTGQPASTRPVAVTQFLSNLSGAHTRLPVLDDKLVVRMREFLFINNVGTVVLDPTAPNATSALALFRGAMGAPLSEGGVDVWFHAQTLARAVQAKTLQG